jgi:hypothetical protein
MAVVLTERQQKCLEYAKQAQELGVSFAEFCRSHDLNPNTWYSIRLDLVRKGVIRGRRKVVEPEAAATATGFAAVRIAPPAAAGMICRIRHPSGWVIECTGRKERGWQNCSRRANMLRPNAQDLQVFLHRAPVDMRKYAPTIVMRIAPYCVT